MAAERPLISIEVAYAEGNKQILIRLDVPKDTTVLKGIMASTILRQFPHLAEAGVLADRVGIFGKICRLDMPLKASDRIEIYRDLLRDPKANRILKARDEKRKKAKAFDEKKRKQKLERKAKADLHKKEKNS